MPKGLHTQGIVVLFEAMPSAEALRKALEPFRIVRSLEGEDKGAPGRWMGGRHGLLLALNEKINGTAPVHAFDDPWPDGMGDPKNDPILFGAWTMGFMGPFAFPGGLSRAVGQAWRWDEAEEVVARHRAFVRIGATYAGGAAEDAPLIPEGYDALDELLAVTRMAMAVGSLPGALGYFNPNGEIVLPIDKLAQSVEYHLGQELPPLDVWSNVRMSVLELSDEWTVMDSVGMAQLDVADQEVCFPRGAADPNEIASFVRNLSDYLRVKGPVIQHGATIEGPRGSVWHGLHAEALLEPPRRVIRWFPEGAELPEQLQQGIGEEEEEG